MLYSDTKIAGVFVVDIERIDDERGFFAYGFDAEEAKSHGIDPTLVQFKISFNHLTGTIRGMHWQDESAPEQKLIRCVRGAIHDVIVDMRPNSTTYLQHVAVELTAENHRALYVPPLCAHGYQTLADATEVTYQVNQAYAPGHERGLRYDDPKLNIRWPLPASLLSPKDRVWPLL